MFLDIKIICCEGEPFTHILCNFLTPDLFFYYNYSRLYLATPLAVSLKMCCENAVSGKRVIFNQKSVILAMLSHMFHL